MSLSERKALHLTGRLPTAVEDINIQKKRVLKYLRSTSSMLEKYILMARLRTTHMRLFYKIVIEELQVYIKRIPFFLFFFFFPFPLINSMIIHRITLYNIMCIIGISTCYLYTYCRYSLSRIF